MFQLGFEGLALRLTVLGCWSLTPVNENLMAKNMNNEMGTRLILRYGLYKGPKGEPSF